MDEHNQPLPLSQSQSGNTNRHHQQMRNAQSAATAAVAAAASTVPLSIQNEILWIKQDALQVRNAVILLEQEKDSLRKAIRKLKLENGRLKIKVKSLNEKVAKLSNEELDDEDGKLAPEAELDYDELNRGDFFLIGGIHDPISLRFEAVIRDKDGVEHKSAERYYWYKMAEIFGDAESMKNILQAQNVQQAEEVMKGIKNFDVVEWDKVKLQHWEDGQRLKLDQVRWIANLLALTKTTYLAISSEDKFFGTGWRKNRDESNKPIFWDGKNEGGKVLMNIRHELKAKHAWNGPQEEEESNTKLREMMRFVWRRIDPSKRAVFGGRSGGMPQGGGGRSGGRGSGNFQYRNH
ncbi:hypothetical protein GPALN_005521 [Globodera pallida]|uniref:DUF1768 domain-containing protein n=1 Tax=Globodera pallida TaxID=36090 RepID=A0A183BHN6_GLOPA|nr:hypothetical protein GPALN_005521 [Globodera pallida]